MPHENNKSSKRKVLNLSEEHLFFSQSHRTLLFSLYLKNLITLQEKSLTSETMSIMHEFILMQVLFITFHGGPALDLVNLKNAKVLLKMLKSNYDQS